MNELEFSEEAVERAARLLAESRAATDAIWLQLGGVRPAMVDEAMPSAREMTRKIIAELRRGSA